MARKPIADMSAWPSLSLEGNLIASAMIAKIYQGDAEEQSCEDYCIRKGLTIREEISTAFRVGQSHFDAFPKHEHPSQDATRRFVAEFLKETFGHSDLESATGAVGLIAGGRVPIVIVSPDETLDRRSPTLSVERSRSPAFALQDYLNDKDEALWGIATNGVHLRLMRDNASLTRPAYIEADLDSIFSNEDMASFAALWLLVHRSRFGKSGSPATDCALERWRDAGAREGAVVRERLADQVRTALKILGSGFLEANPKLRAKLKSGELNLTKWFNELLRLVYRLIFLMVAEDRNLLHPKETKGEARDLYVQGYSLEALREQCYRRATWDKHHDRYESIKIVFRALARGESALGLPALGGLFAEDKLPRLKNADLRNGSFMEALYRLSWLADKTGSVRVNWRDMKTEELGSVYESLLELQPQLDNDGRTLLFASEAADQKGNQRKTTGSYYTPDSLVQALLDTALDPVLDKIENEADKPEKALLKLSVIDPACGSGHFLLAAGQRIATRLAHIRADGDVPTLADFRHALRDVARFCLHGVDLNPMAVELTKVALWIETVDPGFPLGFFDAQIRCGNSLLGVFDLKALRRGIPDAAYKPLKGDDKQTAKYYRKANRDAISGQRTLDFAEADSGMPSIGSLAVGFGGFRNLPENTVRQIGAKAARFEELRKEQAFVRASAAADFYVATFLLPKVDGVPAGPSAHTVPTTEDLRMVLKWGEMRQAMMDAHKVARRARAFHWPLEFPDVMQRGGFDVVLGNPPWERIKLQEQEFFATRSPEIAGAANKAERNKLIKELKKAPEGSTQRKLHDAFIAAKREAEANSEFVRMLGKDGGRFALTGRGDVNTYPLFAQLFADLARQRAGVIVPTGIATDATTAPFFAHLVEERRLAQLVDFENRAGLFSAVDSRMRFALLTLGCDEPRAHFAFFLTKAAQLAEPERNFILSSAEIAAINPNTKTAPAFRSRADAELTAKIYANSPVLIDENKGMEGNPWRVSFVRLFDMSNDSQMFCTAAQLTEGGCARRRTDWENEHECFVPLYEAKMIHLFDHRWAGYDEDGESSSNLEISKKQNPDCEPAPRYWVPQAEVNERLESEDWEHDWLMGLRKITRATDERTVIVAPFPRRAVGDNLQLIFLDQPVAKIAGLIANMSALAFDFIARQKVGGIALNFFYVKQFPVLPPDFYSKQRLGFVVPKVLELSYTSHSLAAFARDLGYDGDPFRWNEEQRALLRADLDAFYARAYRLSRDELCYILDPAKVKGDNYPSETFRVLKKNEIRQHGEYRTERLVLAAWDRMEANDEFTAMGM